MSDIEVKRHTQWMNLSRKKLLNKNRLEGSVSLMASVRNNRIKSCLKYKWSLLNIFRVPTNLELSGILRYGQGNFYGVIFRELLIDELIFACNIHVYIELV